MKTTVRLGILQILVEADDEQELVRKAWDIYRLNEAATQEGYSLDDVMPFAETGSDDNEYAGFIILSDPGKRINFGHTKAGKRWYPRTKGSEYYKGVTQFGQMDTSRQLAEKGERPEIGGQATQRPASHDQAPRPGSPEDGESNPGQILTDMMRELTAAKGDAGALGEVLKRWHNCWERLPAGPFQTAKNNWERFDRIRQDLESMATA